MHIVWQILLWVFGIIVALLLLLCVRVGVIWQVHYKQGFSGKAWLHYGIFKIKPGTLKRFAKKKKPTKEKSEKKEKPGQKKPKEKKKKTPITISEGLALAKMAVRIPFRILRVSELCTHVLVALDDPSQNGMAYGMISGTLYNLYVVLDKRTTMRKHKLSVTPDFTTGCGIAVQSGGKISIRPLPALCSILYDALKDKQIRTILKKLIGGNKS